MNELLAEIISLETELHHGGAFCNPARVEELLHQDFFEVGKSGRCYERSTVVCFLGAQANAPPTVSDTFALQQLSENSVLLTYRSASCLPTGELADHALRASVWSYTNNTWQLRYHQGTLAAQPWQRA